METAVLDLCDSTDQVERKPRSERFVPRPIAPPKHRLRGLAALRAGARNPIELWDEELFQIPGRSIHRLGKRVLEVADPELIHAVLVREADAFKRSELQLRFTRPLVGDGILAASGESWRMQRRAAAPAFRHEALLQLLPAIDAAGRRLVRDLAAPGSVVDAAPLAMRAMLEVTAALLGAGDGVLDQGEIDGAASDYLAGVGLSAVSELMGLGWLHRLAPLKSRRAIARMRAQAARAIVSARDRNNGGLLALLADALVVGDSKTSEALLDSVTAFIAAGAETAALGLTWALHLVANDATIQERLAEESARVVRGRLLTAAMMPALDLHQRVVKEALRLFPPIALVQRTATRPVSIGTWRLAPGDEAVCAIYVMHRSPRLWPQPEVFDPDRFCEASAAGRHRCAFLPFGAGRHACLGLPLAFLEMTGMLAAVTGSLRIAPTRGDAVKPIMRLTLRPEAGMPLSVGPRRRAPAAPERVNAVV